MSKVQTKKRRVDNITNNILFTHYFIQLFLLILMREGHLYTYLMCYINQHLHSKHEPTWATWSSERFSCPWQRRDDLWRCLLTQTFLWYFKNLVLNTFAKQTRFHPWQRYTFQDKKNCGWTEYTTQAFVMGVACNLKQLNK